MRITNLYTYASLFLILGGPRIDARPRLKSYYVPDSYLFMDSAVPAVEKRHQDVGVLPPWQEFCRMLRMGNCWRYKRTAPEQPRPDLYDLYRRLQQIKDFTDH